MIVSCISVSCLQLDNAKGEYMYMKIACMAGLALLLEWMTLARQKELQIHFRNLPTQLWEIAKVSDLEAIIPLADWVYLQYR